VNASVELSRVQHLGTTFTYLHSDTFIPSRLLSIDSWAMQPDSDDIYKRCAVIVTSSINAFSNSKQINYFYNT